MQTIKDCAFCVVYINGRTKLLLYCLTECLRRILTPFFRFTVSFSDKGRSQKTPTSSPSPASQKMSQFDSVGNTAERVKSPAGFSGSATSGLKPHVPLTDLSVGTSRSIGGAASVSGEFFC